MPGGRSLGGQKTGRRRWLAGRPDRADGQRPPAALLGGAVATETVFAWPGLGRAAVDAIRSRDLPVVEGCVIFLAFIFVMVNLLVDLSYAWLDPRIRLGAREKA